MQARIAPRAGHATTRVPLAFQNALFHHHPVHGHVKVAEPLQEARQRRRIVRDRAAAAVSAAASAISTANSACALLARLAARGDIVGQVRQDLRQ